MRHAVVSGAAEKCHISQPALSRSMQKLEDDFGVPLFNRGKNRTALNACGRLAAEGARIPGERRFQQRRRNLSEGIFIPDDLFRELVNLARQGRQS